VLTVASADGWKTPQPTATLRRGGAVAWSRPLPHHHGPRFALVTDEGRVLLVDEVINVRSRQALMLLDAAGTVVARHEFAAVFAALGASEAQLRAAATAGPWLAGPPVLAADQRSALLPAAGRQLAVDLVDGRLTGRPG
jgi:hypothetical protein